jgi:methionyl-tRNA formyltransferase
MSSDFSIAIIGQAAFGESVLNALMDAGENIVGVFCSPDTTGRPVDPIKATAELHGIPVFQFKRMRDADAIDAFKNLNADLGVMAFVTDIVPMEILQAPSQGTIQYHPSLLPKHRGPSSINWPIIQGETKTGLSIFWPDDGLDTGPILMQKEVAVGPDDTLGSVYFDHLFSLGVDAMVESVALVKSGNAPRIEQDHTLMTYEGWCRAVDTVIDWSDSVDAIYNLVRGADPSPGAGSTFNGESVQFYNASKGADSPSETPGTILSIGGEGLEIACTGGTITIRRIKPKGGKKVAVTEWIEQVGVKPGQRFGD